MIDGEMDRGKSHQQTGAAGGGENQAGRSQESKLGDELAQYIETMEGDPNLLCGFEPDTRILFCNGPYAQLWDSTPQHLKQKKWIDLLPEDERPKVQEHLASFHPERPFSRNINYTVDAEGNPRRTAWLNHAFFHSREDEPSYFLAAGACLDVDGQISERAETNEHKFQRMLRAYLILSKSNKMANNATDETTLLNNLCEVAVNVAGYCRAFVAVMNPESPAGTLRPVASAPQDVAWDSNIGGYSAAKGQAYGRPAEEVLYTGAPCVIRDVSNDNRFPEWRQEMLALGHLALAVFPLKLGGESTNAVLHIESHESGAFDEDEMKILHELADDIAVGVQAVRTRAARDKEQALMKAAEKVADMGSWEWNLQSNIWTLSPNMKTILGVQETQLPYEDMLQCGHPHDVPRIRRTIDDALKNRNGFESEFRIVGQTEGAERTLQMRGDVQDDAPDGIARMYGAAQDVTKNRRLETELQTTAANLENVIQLTDDGIMVLDQAGNVLFINPAGAEMMGQSEDDMIGQYFGRPIVEGASTELESISRTTGNPVVIEILRVKETEWNGQSAFLVSLRDITRHKRMEEKIRRDEELLVQTGRMARVGGCGIDLQDNTEMWTRVVRDILEVDENYTLTLENVIGFFRADVQPKLREAIRSAREEGSPYDMELPLITANGRELQVYAFSKLDYYEDGRTHLHVMFQDITGLRKTEQELEERTQDLQGTAKKLRETEKQVIDQERQRALSTMASGIAHDFNNALSPIQGFSKMLLDNPDMLEDREKVIRYLNHIQKSASSAAETIARMRKFYRPQEETVFSNLDLNSVIADAVSITKPRWKEEAKAAGKEIEIETNPGEIPRISGNEGELNEMLTNLIFNAVDAMPEGGRITVTTYMEDEQHIGLAFSDNGTGMPEETRQKCLDPFYTEKGAGGSGLGLATVQGGVHRLNGELAIESTEGEGTTFRITLPVAQCEGETTAQRSTEQPPPVRILVAEDEEMQREMLQEMLGQEGHHTDVAANGGEALEKFDPGEYDLVVTDRAMSEMGGDDLAAKIKEVAPDKPVVMLTGFGDMMDAAGEKPANVDAVLSKPITKEKLLEKIGEVV